MAVLGRGEFNEGRVGTGGDQVDGWPVGRLNEIRDPQILKAEACDRRGDLALGQRGSACGASGGIVLGFGFADQVAGHDAPDSVFLANVVKAHRVGEGGLRVKVYAEHAVTIQRCCMGHVQGDGGLARTAFEVRDGGAEGATARAFGLKRLAARLQATTQGVDLFQSEPPLPPVRLDLTRG